MQQIQTKNDCIHWWDLSPRPLKRKPTPLTTLQVLLFSILTES